MSAASTRHAVSPYARRLAGERGVHVADIAGSGPGGRVVAFDILTATVATKAATKAANTATGPAIEAASKASAPSDPVGTAAHGPAAFAAHGATAPLGRLNDLLASVTAAGGRITRQDAILRAAALALAAHDAGHSALGAAISLETDQGGIVLADIQTLGLGAIATRRETATATPMPDAGLSVRFCPSPGVRSLMLPLKPGCPMRLSVSISADDASADFLLIHDVETVATDRAEAILGSLIDGLAAPLMLLV